MNWNKAQLKAIEERNKNILVAAAAGSGKTAVLVERILRLILEEKVEVDRILVVTFTKAAASEMKSKIIAAIKERIKNTENSEERCFLKKQLENTGSANISTFHSFAIDIIKRYYYITGINPNLKVIDETQAVILKEKAIDTVFDNEFEREENSEFIRMLKKYSSHKGELSLKESIMNFYNKVMAMPDPFIWIEKNVNEFLKYGNSQDMENSELYKITADESLKHLKELYSIKEKMMLFLEENDLLRLAEKPKIDLEYIEDMIKKVAEGNLHDIYSRIVAYKSQVIKATKEEKEAYNDIKDILSVMKDSFNSKLAFIKKYIFPKPVDEQFNEIYESYEYLSVIKELVYSYHKEYMALKTERNWMDFSDIEHYALNILRNKDVAEETRSRFSYIFIDEYQDSNYLQEEIINCIKRKNNLFMVGDIKQSIYSFRLAEPDIFREKYKIYSNHEVDNIKIDLNQNFRCKGGVISGINAVFSEIMEGYDEKAALHQGLIYDDDIRNKYEFPVELDIIELINKRKFRKNNNVEEEFFGAEFNDEIIEELLEREAAELEATYVAKKIKDLEGTDFFDHKRNIVRKTQYGDIVILMRSIKNRGEIFRDVLQENGIPVYLNSNSGFFHSLEIELLLALLTVIDNSCRDIELLSVMKSEIFGFSTDDIMKIRLEFLEGSFNSSVKMYASEGNEESLKNKCKFIVSKLAEWKNIAAFEDLDDFVWRIARESGIYLYAGTLTGGKQRQLNIRTLMDKTSIFIKSGDNTIYGLLNYFEKIKKSVEVGPTSLFSEEDNAVQITTIHKSKGLEYPVVIIPSLSSGISAKEEKGIIDMHRNIGIGLAVKDSKTGEKLKSLSQRMITLRKQKEGIEEELRILYVGMTRAKDRLIMIGSKSEYEKFVSIMETGCVNPKSYLEYIYSPAVKNKGQISINIIDSSSLIVEGNNAKIKNTWQNIKKIIDSERNNDIDPEVKRRLEYIYPYKNDMMIKSKYSASELNRKNVENRKFEFKGLEFSENKERNFSGKRKGNIYHIIMENIDFKKAYENGSDYILDVVNNLKENGNIENLDMEYLEIERIERFFYSSLGKRAAMSHHEKEKRFTVRYEVEGVSTLVQGAVDCYFEENGELVLIDYKTDYNTVNIDRHYEKQMSIYKNALEKATGKKVKECWLYLFSKNEAELVLV